MSAVDDSAEAPRPALVWDLFVRVFHVTLAAGFVAALALATLTSEGSAAFGVHALVGLVVVAAVLLRLVWGLVGTRPARLRSLLFPPAEIAAYLRDLATGRRGREYPGHNPGASVAILALLALVPALGVTGWLTARGSEAAEEVHEVLAWTAAAVVVLHVAGVVLHTLRRRENLAATMVHGRRRVPPAAAIPSARPLAALAFVAVVGTWGAALWRGWDPATGRLAVPLAGTTLALVEAEDEGRASAGAAGAGSAAEAGEHEEEEDDD